MTGERGSATIELAILAPGLLALLGLVLVAGRIEAASSVVEQAAAAAARAASLARTPDAARARVDATVRESLADQGLECAEIRSAVSLEGFRVPVGQPGVVTVSLDCAVALADVAVPGMPGHRIVSAHTSSPLDRYRARR